MDKVIKLIRENGIKIVNLCHIPEDSRLKTLSVPARNMRRTRETLENGERVDGSSLFSHIDPERSDIYIMPMPESAFINPFSSTPTLNVLCRYLDEAGDPLEIAPQSILRRSEEKLKSATGVSLHALAELEFYIFGRKEERFQFSRTELNNYHESSPFCEFEAVRDEILITLENLGVETKYAHAEVGRRQGRDDLYMEQHEIELQTQNLSRMAESVAIAKWVVRNVCRRSGVFATFSPKPSLEHAGSGMHIHLCATKNNANIVADSDGNLTAQGKQMIGGILRLAASLSAFGNTVPASYLRLSSHKESPMHICWGRRDRQALIRIPLWWDFAGSAGSIDSCARTFEFRASDPLANIHYLLAGLTVAVDHGLRTPKATLKLAERLSTESRTGKKRFKALPMSCFEAAESLSKDRGYYEANGVFPQRVIDSIVEKLRVYRDGNLKAEMSKSPEKIEKLLRRSMLEN